MSFLNSLDFLSNLYGLILFVKGFLRLTFMQLHHSSFEYLPSKLATLSPTKKVFYTLCRRVINIKIKQGFSSN